MRAAFLACLFFPLPLLAASTPAEELRALQDALKQAKNKAVLLETELINVNQNMTELQEQSIALAARIQTSEKHIAAKQQSLAQLQSQLTRQRAQFSKRKAALARLLNGIIRLQAVPTSGTLLPADDYATLMQSAAALHITTEAVSHDMAEVTSQLTELHQLEETLSQEQDALEQEQASLQQDQMKMQALLKTRQEQKKRLQTDQEQLAQRMKTLSTQSHSLEELLAKLDKEQSLFQSIGLPQGKPAAPAQRAAAPNKLQPPAIGTVLHRFGETKTGNETYIGQVIATAPAAQITAPHGGRIVFSDRFMDYGPMVLLQADAAHHILLAGLARIDVKVGDQVAAGEPLGIMGKDTPSQKLYLEIRKDSKPIDPAVWMGNLTAGVIRQ